MLIPCILQCLSLSLWHKHHIISSVWRKKPLWLRGMTERVVNLDESTTRSGVFFFPRLRFMPWSQSCRQQEHVSRKHKQIDENIRGRRIDVRRSSFRRRIVTHFSAHRRSWTSQTFRPFHWEGEWSATYYFQQQKQLPTLQWQEHRAGDLWPTADRQFLWYIHTSPHACHNNLKGKNDWREETRGLPLLPKKQKMYFKNTK